MSMFRKIAILPIIFLGSLDEPSKSFTPWAEDYHLGCWRMLTSRPRDWLPNMTLLYCDLGLIVPLGPMLLIYKENFRTPSRRKRTWLDS